ncbi:hypothetical protein SD81_000250 [Tolypothrix campylonemoides VB511288]|nr:hypothetical protein SD81_000250 [Tolypothrix campylonemoides VB511288]
MSKVFVLDTDKRPLNPIHPATARQLLRNQKAAVLRKFPFTIILRAILLKQMSPKGKMQVFI